MGLDLCGSYLPQQNKVRANNIILPNALVTHTDTDSADATDGPSVSIRSIRNGPYRIRRVRNCPYRIRRVHRIRVQILKSFKIQARTSKP